jgi:DNA-binding NtrC family response regulator
MSSAVGQPSVAPKKTALRALIVGHRLREAFAIATLLENCGLEPTVAESFMRAKSRMNRRPPALLITELRLGEFNGLHLVLHGKALRPTMTALVLSDTPDVVLQAEAEVMGATFAVQPLSKRDLLAILSRSLGASGESGPIRPPFERRQAERRGTNVLMHADYRQADRRQTTSRFLS